MPSEWGISGGAGPGYPTGESPQVPSSLARLGATLTIDVPVVWVEADLSSISECAAGQKSEPCCMRSERGTLYAVGVSPYQAVANLSHRCEQFTHIAQPQRRVSV
eukprot:scaffold1158_cov541-Pavlova_lutheri.AAC.2